MILLIYGRVALRGFSSKNPSDTPSGGSDFLRKMKEVGLFASWRILKRVMEMCSL